MGGRNDTHGRILIDELDLAALSRADLEAIGAALARLDCQRFVPLRAALAGVLQGATGGAAAPPRGGVTSAPRSAAGRLRLR